MDRAQAKARGWRERRNARERRDVYTAQFAMRNTLLEEKFTGERTKRQTARKKQAGKNTEPPVELGRFAAPGNRMNFQQRKEMRIRECSGHDETPKGAFACFLGWNVEEMDLKQRKEAHEQLPRKRNGETQCIRTRRGGLF